MNRSNVLYIVLNTCNQHTNLFNGNDGKKYVKYYKKYVKCWVIKNLTMNLWSYSKFDLQITLNLTVRKSASGISSDPGMLNTLMI